MSAGAQLRDPKKLGSKNTKGMRVFRTQSNLARGGIRSTPQKKETNSQARLADQKRMSSEVRTIGQKERSSKKIKGTSLLLALIGKLGN